MGLLLTRKQKCDIQDALEETQVPCETYLGGWIDDRQWAKVFSNYTSYDEEYQREVIEDIKFWMGVFPRGSNMPNPDAYSARLFEYMCEENGLTLLGVKMLLDKMVKSKKQVPSICEVTVELAPIREQYLDFKQSRKDFMRAYSHAQKELIRKLGQAGILEALSDLFDMNELLRGWHILFKGYAFPGCNIRANPYRSDSEADLIVKALMKPRHQNPLLLVFLVIVEISRKDNVTQYNIDDLYVEMKRLYPETPKFRDDPQVFYLPSQWKRLNLGNIKPQPDHDSALFDYETLIPELIYPDAKQTEIVKYIKELTRTHFEFDAMFE